MDNDIRRVGGSASEGQATTTPSGVNPTINTHQNNSFAGMDIRPAASTPSQPVQASAQTAAEQATAPIQTTAEQTPTQPAVSTIQPTTDGTMPAPKPKKKFNWGLVLSVSIPIVIVVGLLSWFIFYHNNKYTVVRDALYAQVATRNNSLTYDATINISGASSTSESIDVKVGLDGVLNYLAEGKADGSASVDIQYNDTSMDIGDINYATDTETLYTKLDLSDDLENLGLDLSEVEDGWIKLSLDDVGSSSTSSDEASKCLQAGNDELENRASQKQLVDALIDTEFLVVTKSGSDSDGTIYELSLDHNHYGDFIRKLVETNYILRMDSCLSSNGSSLDIDELTDEDNIKDTADSIDKLNPKFKIWVKGIFNRQISKANLSVDTTSAGTKVVVDLTVNFTNQTPSISMPSSAKSLEALLQGSSDLQSLTTLFNSGSISTDDEDNQSIDSEFTFDLADDTTDSAE